MGGHSSSPALARGIKQPTRATSRNKPICRPYSVLHPVGFTVPPLLPGTRCALAAPFRPYPSEAGRNPFCGTVPDPRFRGDRRALPGTVVPWSPDFPRESELSRGRPALWHARYRQIHSSLRGAEGDAAIQAAAELLRYARNDGVTAALEATRRAIWPGIRRR